MPCSYSYRKAENLIDVECAGTLSVWEIFQYFLDIREDSAIAQNAIEIARNPDQVAEKIREARCGNLL